jgi:hypothetical protein
LQSSDCQNCEKLKKEIKELKQKLHDARYYGSDLNEYIGKNLPKIMTAINIDLAIHKIRKKKIRIIESKHIGEPIGEKQEILLQTLADDLNLLNNLNIAECEYEVYKATGNEPYNELQLYNFIKKEFIILKDDDVRKFLTVEL